MRLDVLLTKSVRDGTSSGAVLVAAHLVGAKPRPRWWCVDRHRDHASQWQSWTPHWWPSKTPHPANGVGPPACCLGRSVPGSGTVERRTRCIYVPGAIYTEGVAKHLVDLDEKALSRAQAELGTTTIKDTVNLALEATSSRHQRVVAALDLLASTGLEDRSEAWR